MMFKHRQKQDEEVARSTNSLTPNQLPPLTRLENEKTSNQIANGDSQIEEIRQKYITVRQSIWSLAILSSFLMIMLSIDFTIFMECSIATHNSCFYNSVLLDGYNFLIWLLVAAVSAIIISFLKIPLEKALWFLNFISQFFK